MKSSKLPTHPGCHLWRYVIALLSITATPCHAESSAVLHKFSGFEFGYGTFKFKEKLDQTLVYPVASLTLGGAYQRFNLSLNISGSVENAEVSEESFTGSASREDFDLTLGYQVNKEFSVFTGYKSGKTELNLTNRVDPPLADGYEYYKQVGPYLGVNYNMNLDEAGKFSFSLAYAELATENKFVSDGDTVEPGETLEFDDISGVTRGRSKGYSYSVNWSRPLKGNFIFRTRLRINKYKQSIHYGGKTFDNVAESSTMLLVGAVYIF